MPDHIIVYPENFISEIVKCLLQSQYDQEMSAIEQFRANQMFSQTNPSTHYFSGTANFSQDPNNLNFNNLNIASQAFQI